MRQRGQIIVILLLIILVSLTVGLAIVQNSLTDLSTSTKVDQSSRAFAAAEAGLESALANLNPPNNIPIGNLGNNASANVIIAKDLPVSPNLTLEYPPLTKADFAQFWFQDPVTSTNARDYKKSRFLVYFGSCSTSSNCNFSASEEPAIEVNVLVKELSGNYYTIRRFYDPLINRTSTTNNFTKINGQIGTCSNSGVTASTNFSPPPSRFYCQVVVDLRTPPASDPNSQYKNHFTDVPILARVRILYSTNNAQKVALGPVNPCSLPCIYPALSNQNLPPQASMYTSKGTSGDAVRQLRIFKEQDVVPFFFDFAIYSEGMITK